MCMWPAIESYTAMHTGGRSRADIDAGGVLADFAGVIVRDGYAAWWPLNTPGAVRTFSGTSKLSTTPTRTGR